MQTSTLDLYRNTVARIARPARYYTPEAKGAQPSDHDRALNRDATYIRPQASSP